MSDELIAEAEIGEEARKFLESDLGKVLVGFAEQEILSAQVGLEKVSPHNISAIQGFQLQARFGRSFKDWLAELVSRGNAAMEAYKQQRDS